MCQAGVAGYVLSMTADDNGRQAQTEEELTAQVAQLAGEISEAKTTSRRKRLAEQLPKLASSSRARSRQGLQSGSQAVQSRLRAGGDIAKRGVQAGGAAARKGAAVGGSAARAGAQVGGTAWQGVRQGGQWLTGQVVEMAPKVPIRSDSTLRQQYPGLATDELANALIESAARASAGVGAAVGAATALPFLPTAPVEIGVEVLALIGIELKLIAELHEVYGMPAPGSGPERMLAYLTAWADRRGVRLTAAGLDLALGTPLRHRLERRVLVKTGQSTLSLAPLLTGAAVGAWLDHHETRRLGRRVRDDLRKRAPAQPSAG
jgi:hypothetical protein